jgi:hypothetical protein
VQLITITTKIGESFEENCEVEAYIKQEIVGEIFVEVDEKEKSCLDAIYVDFSQVPFFKGAACVMFQRKLEGEFFSSGRV